MWESTGYGQTNRGLVRPTNQDTFLVDNRHRLWAVADGMGGHAGGDVASRLVMESLAEFAPTLAQTPSAPNTDEEERLTLILTTMAQQAHASILAHADRHPPLRGMGTTLVMAHLLPLPTPRLLVLNVGDSRAYLLRAETLTQLTRDHTLIEEQVRDGRLTPAQAARHPDRHVLTRAMGIGAHVESDLFSFDLLPGDLLLLCSDGLTKMLTDERILHTVLPHRNHPSLATRTLIETALDAGGIDNVTAVVCPITEIPDQANIH
ncbi:MAG: protein phosphatase 2C domain-containing protein [Nitrospira sp.]|nr:protein phosphatase 2C domain-containing protein [Nitrospira sp.]